MREPIPKPKLEKWSIDRLKPNECDLARHSPETIEQLAQSLLDKGLLQAIGAMESGAIIYGNGRWLAATKAGIKELDVQVYTASLTPTQFNLIRASENLHRTDLKPYQKFRLCEELLEANPDWKMVDLSEALNIDPSMATRLLSPLKCSPAWVEALRTEQVTISDCYQASLADPETQEALLKMKLSGASRDELARARRQKETPDDAPKVSRIRCSLPSGVQVAVSGAELSLDALIDALREVIAEADRARKQRLDIRTLARVMADKAKN